jgi:hypothetical protein
MESLPDKSIVVSVAASTKYMSGSMFALIVDSTNHRADTGTIRYIVSFFLLQR